MSKLTEDEIIAKECSVPVDSVRAAKKDWANNLIMRALFEHRIRAQVNERKESLTHPANTPGLDDVRQKQGDISGLKLALAIINKSES